MPLNPNYQKSLESSYKAADKSDRFHEKAEKLGGQGDSRGGYFSDRAHRYSLASEYLDSRARRPYGSGHDMKQHGEGKPHGAK